MKSLLFIEDLYEDYSWYSSKIFINNGYYVFPPKDIIKNQICLNDFLGKNVEVEDYTNKESKIYSSLKKNIFKFINDNELYKKLSLIVIDINLTSTRNEKMGLDFLSSFRLEFIANNSQYKDWNKTIPVIALSIYSENKYENDFISYPGYLMSFYNKDEVRAKPDRMIKSMNNLHEQMSSIYPLFFDPELKEILRKINAHEKYLKEIKQISKLILFAEIAHMPANKRIAYVDSFAKELIRYCKESYAFMEQIENIEDSFSEKLKAIFNSPHLQALSFITRLVSFLQIYIKPEAIPEVINFIMSLSQQLFS